jgi:maltose-binding protein MalE
MPIIPEMGFFWSNAGSMYMNAWNGTRTPIEAATIAQNGFTSQSGIPQSED